MVAPSNTKDNMKMLRNKRSNNLLGELEAYLNWCREWGYKYDEKDFYRRNTPYGQYERWLRGDTVVNNWVEDAKRFGRPIDYTEESTAAAE